MMAVTVAESQGELLQYLPGMRMFRDWVQLVPGFKNILYKNSATGFVAGKETGIALKQGIIPQYRSRKRR
jgi:hypothetical protein